MKSDENEKSILFEQYKLMVETADKISDRRMTQNNIFITINIAFFSFVMSTAIKTIPLICFSVIGIIIAIVWVKTIKNYKMRNAIKFEIINEIEEKNFSPLFKRENEQFNKYSKIYPLTSFELILPIVFLIIYISMLLFSVYSL